MTAPKAPSPLPPSPSGPTGPATGSPLSELARRIASGIVLIIVALLTTWTGGLIAVVAFLILALFVLVEWERLTGAKSQGRLVSGIAIVAVAAFLAHYVGPLAAMGVGTALLFLALGAALLESPRRWSFTGMAYATWLVVSLVSLRGHDDGGLSAILFVFAAVWTTDIAAYFGGRAIGGPKLMRKVSPNKTWSGAVTGMVCAVLVCVGYLVWADGPIAQHASTRTDVSAIAFAALLAAFLSVTAQAGDLFESGLKRKFGVKDSGSILPGHGGFMDRVDGLVFASTAAFLIGLAHKGEGTVAQGLLTWGIQ